MAQELRNSELLLLGAVLARRTYGIKFDIEDYCIKHKLNREKIFAALKRLKGNKSYSMIFEDELGFIEITECGFENILPDIHRLKELVTKNGDIISQLVFGVIAGPIADDMGDGNRDFISDERKKKFQQDFSSEINRTAFVRLLKNAYSNIEKHTSVNAEIAQAKAFIESAIILTECPNPESGIVWDIISKASNMASVGGLFLAIIAFILSS